MCNTAYIPHGQLTIPIASDLSETIAFQKWPNWQEIRKCRYEFEELKTKLQPHWILLLKRKTLIKWILNMNNLMCLNFYFFLIGWYYWHLPFCKTNSINCVCLCLNIKKERKVWVISPNQKKIEVMTRKIIHIEKFNL